MLDDSLLSDYMSRFFGYGSWSAKYWFIGMEEGSGGSIDEVSRRLSAWEQRGRPEIDDLYEFNKLTGITQWFGDNAKRQATWAQLCRTALVAEGENADAENLIEYQRSKIGRQGGATSLIELLPLPSRKKAAWIYAGTSNLEILESRRRYEKSIRPQRLSKLREKISMHQPSAVVFYGDRRRWNQEFSMVRENDDFAVGKLGRTLLIATAHPMARGKVNERFTAIGQLIRERALHVHLV